MELSDIYGMRIESIEIAYDEVISIEFDNGDPLVLRDTQSCCESRYFRTDDDLPYYAGSELRKVVVTGYGDFEGNGCHEVMFLEIHTSKGVVSFCAHNEHNGWYGGFSIQAHRGESRCIVSEEA